MNQNGGGGSSPLDGFPITGKPEEIAKEFLNPGANILDYLVRAGMPMGDAMDWLQVWNDGIMFQVPELSYRASGAFAAAKGADRMAIQEALQGSSGSSLISRLKQRMSGFAGRAMGDTSDVPVQ